MTKCWIPWLLIGLFAPIVHAQQSDEPHAQETPTQATEEKTEEKVEGDPLERGVKLYDMGAFAKAAEIFESDEGNAERPAALRFNAGVSHLKAGVFDEAARRFEEVSVRATGDLKLSAFYNLGYTRFEEGMALRNGADEVEDLESKLQQLISAAEALKKGLSFFQQARRESIETRNDPEIIHNIGVTKTALRAVIDEITQIEAAMREKEQEEALKEPVKLLFDLMTRERTRRLFTKAFVDLPDRKQRIGARKLRKDESASRELMEKLKRHLAEYDPAAQAQQPPMQQGTQPGATTTPDEGPSLEDRFLHASERSKPVIAKQREAEAALSELEWETAEAAMADAVRNMRQALSVLPLEFQLVLGDSLTVGSQTLGISEKIVQATGGDDQASDPIKDLSGASDMAGDEALGGLVSIIPPAHLEASTPLADGMEHVAWGAQVLKSTPPAAQQSSSPTAPPGMQSPPGDQPNPGLDESTTAQIHSLAALAENAARLARDELENARIPQSLPHQREALDALTQIAELLPKPPKTFEERIKELIQKEEAVRNALDNLDDVRDGREEMLEAFTAQQEENGQNADALAKEMSQSQDEKYHAPSEKVAEASLQVFDSAEATRTDLLDVAKPATDQAVKLLKEALDMLENKDDKKDEQQQDQQKKEEQKKDQQNQDQQQDQQQQDQQQQSQPKELTPREARLAMDEMDKERNEAEEKLAPAASRISVGKDW
jgi:hypothetical protein